MSKLDTKLEVVVVPVADVDRSKRFYGSLGWRLDADIEAARADLVARGVDVREVFHRAGAGGNASGRDPNGQSYASFASFSDPDGNSWLLQEITARLPGRVDPDVAAFESPVELANALRRAAAHGEHEKRIGQRDENWPEWYAEYMVRERTGGQLPW